MSAPSDLSRQADRLDRVPSQAFSARRRGHVTIPTPSEANQRPAATICNAYGLLSKNAGSEAANVPWTSPSVTAALTAERPQGARWPIPLVDPCSAARQHKRNDPHKQNLLQACRF